MLVLPCPSYILLLIFFKNANAIFLLMIFVRVNNVKNLLGSLNHYLLLRFIPILAAFLLGFFVLHPVHGPPGPSGYDGACMKLSGYKLAVATVGNMASVEVFFPFLVNFLVEGGSQQEFYFLIFEESAD